MAPGDGSNLSTHSRKALVDYFGEEAGGWLWDRFTMHYTPKHASWLNQAEIEIGIFSRQCLGKRRIGDMETLRGQSMEPTYQSGKNQNQMEVYPENRKA
jgi:hypothetical protein